MCPSRVRYGSELQMEHIYPKRRRIEHGLGLVGLTLNASKFSEQPLHPFRCLTNQARPDELEFHHFLFSWLKISRTPLQKSVSMAGYLSHLQQHPLFVRAVYLHQPCSVLTLTGSSPDVLHPLEFQLATLSSQTLMMLMTLLCLMTAHRNGQKSLWTSTQSLIQWVYTHRGWRLKTRIPDVDYQSSQFRSSGTL